MKKRLTMIEEKPEFISEIKVVIRITSEERVEKYRKILNLYYQNGSFSSSEENTLLHVACFCGDDYLDTIQDLNRNNPNWLISRNEDGECPIHCALDTIVPSQNVVKYLLQELLKKKEYLNNLNDINSLFVNKDSESIFHIIIKNDSKYYYIIKIIEQILYVFYEEIAKESVYHLNVCQKVLYHIINYQDINGNTPIHLSVKLIQSEYCREVLQSLLAYDKINLTLINHNKDTLFHLCFIIIDNFPKDNFLYIIKMLCDYGLQNDQLYQQIFTENNLCDTLFTGMISNFTPLEVMDCLKFDLKQLLKCVCRFPNLSFVEELQILINEKDPVGLYNEVDPLRQITKNIAFLCKKNTTVTTIVSTSNLGKKFELIEKKNTEITYSFKTHIKSLVQLLKIFTSNDFVMISNKNEVIDNLNEIYNFYPNVRDMMYKDKEIAQNIELINNIITIENNLVILGFMDHNA